MLTNRPQSTAQVLAVCGLLCFSLMNLPGCHRAVEASIPAEPEPVPAGLKNISHLANQPIVVQLPMNADWNTAPKIPAPRISYVAQIQAPVLEPIPFSAAEEALSAAHTDLGSPDLVLADMPEVAAAKALQVELPPLDPDASRIILGTDIAAGSLVQTNWTAGESLHGAQIPTPVLIAHGRDAGPTLCITAAVHGDELNGIEAVRRVMYSIKPEKLSGTVIGVPIVNLQGFQRQSRYLSDRRDLNRFFPGNPRGSSASRMAYSFFRDVISHCSGLVDLHTGSFHRTNLPQLRADLNNADVLALTKGFGSTVILHSSGGLGTLRRAASDAGIPAVTLEAGEPLRLQKTSVDHTVKALFTLMDTMHMYNKRSLWGNPEPTYYSSAWVRADQGGILLSEVKLGRRVKSGDLLGTVTDPITNEEVPISAPYPGRVIGMALNQFVMPGFATFHIATEAELDDMPQNEGSDEHAEGLDVAVAESQGSEESEE